MIQNILLPTFHTYSGELIIKVPAESLNAYKAAPGFSDVADHIFAIKD